MISLIRATGMESLPFVKSTLDYVTGQPKTQPAEPPTVPTAPKPVREHFHTRKSLPEGGYGKREPAMPFEFPNEILAKIVDRLGGSDAVVFSHEFLQLLPKRREDIFAHVDNPFLRNYLLMRLAKVYPGKHQSLQGMLFAAAYLHRDLHRRIFAGAARQLDCSDNANVKIFEKLLGEAKEKHDDRSQLELGTHSDILPADEQTRFRKASLHGLTNLRARMVAIGEITKLEDDADFSEGFYHVMNAGPATPWLISVAATMLRRRDDVWPEHVVFLLERSQDIEEISNILEEYRVRYQPANVWTVVQAAMENESVLAALHGDNATHGDDATTHTLHKTLLKCMGKLESTHRVEFFDMLDHLVASPRLRSDLLTNLSYLTATQQEERIPSLLSRISTVREFLEMKPARRALKTDVQHTLLTTAYNKMTNPELRARILQELIFDVSTKEKKAEFIHRLLDQPVDLESVEVIAQSFLWMRESAHEIFQRLRDGYTSPTVQIKLLESLKYLRLPHDEDYAELRILRERAGTDVEVLQAVAQHVKQANYATKRICDEISALCRKTHERSVFRPLIAALKEANPSIELPPSLMIPMIYALQRSAQLDVNDTDIAFLLHRFSRH